MIWNRQQYIAHCQYKFTDREMFRAFFDPLMRLGDHGFSSLFAENCAVCTKNIHKKVQNDALTFPVWFPRSAKEPTIFPPHMPGVGNFLQKFPCSFLLRFPAFAAHLRRRRVRGRGPSQPPKFLSPATLSPWLSERGGVPHQKTQGARDQKHSERGRERVFRAGRAE